MIMNEAVHILSGFWAARNIIWRGKAGRHWVLPFFFFLLPRPFGLGIILSCYGYGRNFDFSVGLERPVGCVVCRTTQVRCAALAGYASLLFAEDAGSDHEF
ncbi:hypothetical protein LZ31DRAFT_5265 [Colletotrichum somersetense]|nr:hypothetical protein LZ31DRAFT_5265 [Colletotrichum somersetense]